MTRHPGRVLREDFMEPLGLTVAGLADLAGVSQQRLYELLAGKRGVSVDTALRLARVFRMKPQHWLAMQTEWDLAQVMRPEGVQRANLKGFVTGPAGVLPLPSTPSRPNPDTSFPDEMYVAVQKASALMAPWRTT